MEGVENMTEQLAAQKRLDMLKTSSAQTVESRTPGPGHVPGEIRAGAADADVRRQVAMAWLKTAMSELAALP